MQNMKERLSIPDPEALTAELVGFIHDTVAREGRQGCVLGISGGIDSAVVAALALRALGPDRVQLLYLPERDSHRRSRLDALLVARQLGLPVKEVNISPILSKMKVYKLQPPMFLTPRSIVEGIITRMDQRTDLDTARASYIRTLRGQADEDLQRVTAYCRSKNRVRMAVLYQYAELSHSLVLGTCNRSENMTGLFVIHGDGACDLAPLHGLYKTQVFALARHLGLPESIIAKQPVGDLMPGITDESSLRMSYDTLDPILAGLELGWDDAAIVDSGALPNDVTYVRDVIAASEFAREGAYKPPIRGRADLREH